MADTFKQLNAARTTTYIDLEQGRFGAWWKLRDSFKYTPGEVSRVDSLQPGPRGGTMVVEEWETNGTIAATMVVTGMGRGKPVGQTNHDDAEANLRDLITGLRRVGGIGAAGFEQIWLEWRPDGAPTSFFFDQQGSADIDMDYHWAQFASGEPFVPLAVVFHVRPLDLSA